MSFLRSAARGPISGYSSQASSLYYRSSSRKSLPIEMQPLLTHTVVKHIFRGAEALWWGNSHIESTWPWTLATTYQYVRSFLQGLETSSSSEYHWCGYLGFRAALYKKHGAGSTTATSWGLSRNTRKWEQRWERQKPTLSVGYRPAVGGNGPLQRPLQPALWSSTLEEEPKENHRPEGLGSELLQEQRLGRGTCRGC